MTELTVAFKSFTLLGIRGFLITSQLYTKPSVAKVCKRSLGRCFCTHRNNMQALYRGGRVHVNDCPSTPIRRPHRFATTSLNICFSAGLVLVPNQRSIADLRDPNSTKATTTGMNVLKTHCAADTFDDGAPCKVLLVCTDVKGE